MYEANHESDAKMRAGATQEKSLHFRTAEAVCACETVRRTSNGRTFEHAHRKCDRHAVHVSGRRLQRRVDIGVSILKNHCDLV